MVPAELLSFTFFFVLFSSRAGERGEDDGVLDKSIVVQGVTFVLFAVLFYTMKKGVMTPRGAIYLLSLGLVRGGRICFHGEGVCGNAAAGL
jgi:hypothetical protein